MIFSILAFVISILILAKASDWTITGAISIARYLKLSDLVIGFFLISFATSLPELSVAISSGLSHAGGISLGNILGSNIVNIALTAGVMGILGKTIFIKKEDIKKLNKMILISIIIIPFILLSPQLGVLEGIILILLFLIFLMYTIKNEISLEYEGKRPTRKQAITGLSYFLIGISLVIFSSSYAVENGIHIIVNFGITQSFLGATLIAIGTTLPELMVSVKALQKKHFNLALGNILGSCIINLTLILGIGAVLAPIIIEQPIIFIISFFLMVSIITLHHFLRTDNRLKRNEGIVLVMVYIVYLLTLFAIQTHILL
ncbi:sodium:calcium antiporter [Candidatus Micrarchaeota archaeon]|nr:sodium:calcium antiporter [Candidatus Micrarchaeota archaeon]